MDPNVSKLGGISPILANIYLHYALDLWFEREVKPQLTGYAQLVRYAGDNVFCFENVTEARVFGEALRQQLGKFGLARYPRGRVESSSLDDLHARGQSDMARSVQRLTFLVLRTSAIKPEAGILRLGERRQARSSGRR
jgi:hypothetical protein